MERYSEYKDSGVKWLGEIPSHWEIMPIKHSYNFTVGWTPPTGRSDLFEGNNLWANISDLGKKEIYNTANHISDSAVRLSGRSISPKGSLLYSFKLSVGTVSFCGADMYTNEAIATFLKGTNSLEYLYYAAPLFIIKNANTNIYGAPILNQDLIKNALVLLPPRAEQDAIVRYLDAATSKIDKAIAMQQKMIDLLNERKQIIIQNAVTKGLDENVEMKDSGVECFGLIPSHWKVIGWNHIFENLDKLREPISAEQRSRNNPKYDYYGASGVIDKIDYYNVDDKVLLIGEDGANLKMRNLPLVYKASGKIWVNNHAHILKPKVDSYDYMAYLMELFDYNPYITGSAQPKLSQEQLGTIRLCVPPIDEQNKIAIHLNKHLHGFDSAISNCQRQITLLQERKQIIINEVVTGKVKVS